MSLSHGLPHLSSLEGNFGNVDLMELTCSIAIYEESSSIFIRSEFGWYILSRGSKGIAPWMEEQSQCNLLLLCKYILL